MEFKCITQQDNLALSLVVYIRAVCMLPAVFLITSTLCFLLKHDKFDGGTKKYHRKVICIALS